MGVAARRSFDPNYCVIRWNPPRVGENGTSSPVWLRSRLAKVAAGMIILCFAVYLALLDLSGADFLKEYIVLLPECFPGPALPRNHLTTIPSSRIHA